VNEALHRAIERCERASLVFDLHAIVDNMRALAAAARAATISPLFAMKSFPRDEVRALAAELLDGLDVASPGELAAAPPRGILSIVDPSGLAIGLAPRDRRVLVGCETVDQVRAAPSHAELAIRISASITGRDPAIGAILEGSGRRTSRFGIDTREALTALLHEAGSRPVGIHLHHGPVTATTAERFIATARAALALFADADREPAFLNLGGAWHGIDDLPTAFTQLRAALPGLELFVEPGRTYAAGAGFASGRVLATRELSDRVLSTVELSRACHLRWSQPELVAPPPRADARRKVMLVGPTCYEEDVIGEWIVDPAHVASRVILRNITGYAVAWNTGFGGIAPADVVLVEA
jgi:diaminopimelate decarboxylase